MSRGTPIAILTEARDLQHTAALTWQECDAILVALAQVELERDWLREQAARGVILRNKIRAALRGDA